MPPVPTVSEPVVLPPSVRTTRWVAIALVAWLSLLVLGVGFATAVLLSSAEDYTDSKPFQMVLCMAGGALGASLTALLAAGERIARGWAFGRDALARSERGFNARLAPLLAVQPILGAALGLVLLLGLSAGTVVLLRLSEGTTFDPMGLLLVSVIGGLFARTLLARVRDSVEALFGRPTQPDDPVPLRGAPPQAEGPRPEAPAPGSSVPAPAAAAAPREPLPSLDFDLPAGADRPAR